ncbi:amidohydrolase family protein [Streptomyces iconiensis]|uniref:Amidohydrolase family protein n=1 Tax=Streptomyces iconiensis TaxID=1384038 RepID=A0ABT7A6W8_9ACTN|nr:amidohydrolase family protein [Streptomyces iconiensis]MDJ1136378.1 amidohydrolase family protein [Streptomyces iconiensis]
MIRIDAHHHLWVLSRRALPWMDGAWADPIHRTWTEDDLLPHLDAHGIDATVVVQASHSTGETRELLALKERSAHVAAVVGWADLTAPGGPRLPTGLAGVRHQTEGLDDPAWLSRADVRHGLARLAEAGLVYDLLVTPRELPSAVETVRALPELEFVLDHAAKPRIAVGEWEPWAGLLDQLAALPNVSCKLSGLVTEADWETWTQTEALPYARHVLDAFGPERVLFGSDWPVCTLAATYDEVAALADEATADLTQDERAAVFGGNAARVYGITDA